VCPLAGRGKWDGSLLAWKIVRYLADGKVECLLASLLSSNFYSFRKVHHLNFG